MTELNERKLNILKAIVKDYIDTAEAVGSRTLSKKYELGISAATIRNEMADLEEMGYLIQPHTSSGRIPSDKGYKLYVDSLMKEYELNTVEKHLIEESINKNMNYMNNLIHETSKLISKLTNYTTIAVTKNVSNLQNIKHIQLVGLDEKSIVLIIVTEKGEIKNTTISTNTYIDQAKLNLISDKLTRKLAGKNICEIDEEFLNYIKYEIAENSLIIDKLVESLNFGIEKNETSISLSGATNIFNFPEFSDVVRAKTFLTMLEEKDNISNMLKSKGIQKENLNIIIGSDNQCEVAQDCSIITATYNIDKDVVGKISLIGPTRMDYAKVYSILNYMGLLLNKK
ncbi:heat-inducible transcriptional repressor HrcA [Paraclostridium sordellii]|uniref:Heat-inducible transcription repressor HrcA n=1 Tax=Paraclostridium sordellii TaxID=1505 RepID=A0A0C7R0N0_PARSO|nr:heat-inducible transcriptional repressor HrcA [Paeniclostridium sordellii]QYE98536.1 heat-inducible transcriptional repressor HrcA [Paeniclostridium sordellii]CEN79608.1 heat-inducible transcription repressor [[Clostridium] sordellii] [Paeniclostridium sordellii]CEO05538.1 heat-inducible transcription repressor [[Clostridium] sordellii] [Paeniclostridium sordellii]CEP86099.1 heat-inducible transcription repressor [[Clostridium] sordellii] [Paeniclostridium sordellii]CEP96352.1 heat-inducibl